MKLLIVLLLSGCTTMQSSQAQRIKVADVAPGCELVAEVHGSSGWGGIGASVGMQNAKNEALEQAGKAGATHVIWAQIIGGANPFVTGKAYRCA